MLTVKRIIYPQSKENNAKQASNEPILGFL